MNFSYLKTTSWFILLLFFAGCYNNNRDLIYYHQAISYISDTSLYNHFPVDNIIKKNSIGIPCKGGTGLKIIIFLKKDDKQLNRFIKKHKSLPTYTIKDSCTNYYLYEDDNLMQEYGNCIKKNPPVPNYRFWNDPDETMFDYEDIKKDLTYYLLESKSGKYLPDSLLTKRYQPPYEYVWNGFSRGYAISKEANLIVYWLLVW